MIWYAVYIAVFVVVMYAIGTYHYRRTDSMDDYLVADRGVGGVLLAMTVIATFTGASIFIGSVGLGYTHGLSGYFRLSLPAAVFSLLLVLLFARRLRETRLYTTPDLFNERFGRPAGIVPALLSVFLYAAPVTAMQLVAMGALFVNVFGMPLVWSLVLSWLIAFGYTLIGGLPSVILTDAIQTVVLVGGLVLMGVVTWQHAGGVDRVAATTPDGHLSVLGADPSSTLVYALTIGPFYLVWQSTWQRIYAAKTARTAVWGNAVGIVFAGIVLAIIPVMIGMAARGFVAGDDLAPDTVFYVVMQDLLPPYLGGILAMGLMAALVSGADSFLLQGAANVTRDLYQRHLRPEADQQHLLRVSRWSVAGISVLALLISFAITDIVGIYTYTLKWTAVATVPAFLAIMFWRRATRFGAIASMAGGLATTIVWELLGNPAGVPEVVPGYLVGLALLVGGSLATAHAGNERVAAVWFDGLVARSEPDEHAPVEGASRA